MSNSKAPAAGEWTVADLLAHFGPVPFRRVRPTPAPGTATEQDVLDIHHREDRLYELSDGVLLEKDSGVQESYLAASIGGALQGFAHRQDLGFVLGADGMTRLAPGLLRIPDASFVSWGRLGHRRVPHLTILPFAPDLAVEVVGSGNTTEEMDRKRHEYIRTGVALVWYVDPVSRAVRVFRSTGQAAVLREGDDLTGDPVLPGFILPVCDLFAELES